MKLQDFENLVFPYYIFSKFLNLTELLVTFIFSQLVYFYYMHFNLSTVKLLSDFEKASNFQVWYLLQEDAYERAALILS